MEQGYQAANKFNYRQLLVFILIRACMGNAYWITMFNTTNLEGNKFVNGLILATADISAGVSSGIVMQYISKRRALQLFTLTGIVFGMLNTFFVP